LGRIILEINFFRKSKYDHLFFSVSDSIDAFRDFTTHASEPDWENRLFIKKNVSGVISTNMTSAKLN